MDWKKSLFRFYINGSLHVALAICALAGLTFLTYNLAWDGWFFLFIFSASITGYNFVKYAGYAKFHHRSLTRQLRGIQAFSFLCFILLLISLLKQSQPFILYASALGLFTLLYAVPFLPHHKNLRHIKILKIIIIAVVWALATAGLPLLDKVDFDTLSLLRILNYFVFVLAIIIPFEIRDLKFDAPNLGTLPQLIGVTKTKKIGYFLLALYLLISFQLQLQPFALTINFVMALLAGAAIKYASRNQTSYYAAFWVEGLPIIWLLLSLVAQRVA